MSPLTLEGEGEKENAQMNTLVLLDSSHRRSSEGTQFVLPYLDHFGVAYTALDLAHAPLPADLTPYALVIAAHAGLRLDGAGRQDLLRAAGRGTGLVSFDPALPSAADLGAQLPARPAWADAVEFAPTPHYITARHEPGSALPLAGRLRVPPMPALPQGILLGAAGRPLLTATSLRNGRLVQWATAGWMHSSVLGPLGGLDDVLWRGLVWAARKPFALRGLAPLVTMRVDDVLGSGTRWGRTPFYWVQEAARHGLKPWLGLFIDNLTDPAVAELRDLILRGQACVFPHAFSVLGRPELADVSYRGQPAAPLFERRSAAFARRHRRPPDPSELDEFIYFDHHGRRPWPQGELARRLAVVDEWFAARAPFPMSHYAVPHWYEAAPEALAYVHDCWGAEFAGTTLPPGARYSTRSDWLMAGPFRLHERPGAGIITRARRGQRPVYYADWLQVAGRRFFNCLTEIRDDAGYDWKPDNDVAATIGRGVRQLRRALDSMALAVLVAHETDHIYLVEPQAWAAEVAGVARGIAGYHPILMGMDEALRYVRATRTSRLESARFDAATRQVSAIFTGCADVATHFYLFTEAGDDIAQRLVDVPAFEGQATVQARVG